MTLASFPRCREAFLTWVREFSEQVRVFETKGTTVGCESAPFSPTLEEDSAHPNGRGIPDSVCRGEPGKESFELAWSENFTT